MFRCSGKIRTLSVLLLVSGVLVACGSTSLPAPTTTGTENLITVPVLTIEPGTPVVTDEALRRKTVIFDIDGGTVAEPLLWNPLLETTSLSAGFHQALVEPLFILNYESGAIEPWLGETMTSNATMDVWTLTLREGITWSDGEAFNADDVVFTFDLLLHKDPDHALRYSAVMKDWVAEVQKRDDLTVEFTLQRPNPRFQLDYFAVKIWGSVPIVPEHIWKDQDVLTFTNYDPEKGWPVFTGPYTLHEASSRQFTYVRDDSWWGARAGFKPLPRPERLIWVATDTEAERIALANQGQLDSMMDITPDGFLALRERNPNIIAWLDDLPYAWLDPCPRLLSLNHTVAPWDDKDMRWALNFAIDREEIVREAYHGTTLPARHFFPAYAAMNHYIQLLEEQGLYEQYPLMVHDPERAQRLIESEGWHKEGDGFYQRDGETLALAIQVNEAFVEKQRLGAVLSRQLQAVGIDARMQALEDNEWEENKSKGLYQAVIDWDACDAVNEPWASLNRYHEQWVQPIGEPMVAENNHIRWRNEEYSQLVDEMGVLPIGDLRVDSLFLGAMHIWFEELPFIPLTQARKLIPFNTTYWEGWPTAEENHIHPPTWWQSTHMIIHHLEPAQREEGNGNP